MSAVEREFIFDAVVGFLTSPIWNTPVRTFIEENSLVFDSDGENHEAYKEIHNKYKEMVETLLASFLKDVGISEEQFMTACKNGSGSPQFNGMNRDVFDQMWAAEDFEVFKRLMIQKNVELQLQALQLLQTLHNVQMPMPMPTQMPMPVPVAPANAPTQMPIPVPVAPANAPLPPSPSMDEDAIMQEVLKRSKEEYESKQKDAKGKTEQELEKTIAQSKEESERQSLSLANLESVVNEESSRLSKIAKREQEELEKALQISLEAQKKQSAEAEKLRDEVKQSAPKTTPQPTPVDSKPAPKPSPAASKTVPKPSPTESKKASKPSPVKAKSPMQQEAKTSGLPPLSGQTKKEAASGLPPLSGQTKKEADKPSEAAAGWLKSAKEDATSGASFTPEPKPEITEEELKRRSAYLKQQRDKLLALKKQEREKHLTKYTEQQPKARPTSSRAARQVTAGEQVDSPSSQSGEDDGKKLAMRRALADCLKREVIDKN